MLYAYRPRAAQHEKSRAWLERVLSGPDLVRFAWLTLWAFLRIATNPRVFERSLSASEAEAAIASWLPQPVAGIIEPGERHWDILRGLLRDGQTTGPLIIDAVLAAIALERGAMLCTTDCDFSRFSGIEWMNPLAANGWRPRCNTNLNNHQPVQARDTNTNAEHLGSASTQVGITTPVFMPLLRAGGSH